MARARVAPRRGLRLAALVVLLAAVLGSGCGELGGDTRPPRRSPIVTESSLARLQPDAPARAFLEWFRALQLGESRALADHYVPSLGLTPATLARQRKAGAYAIDPLAPPVIEQVDVDGDRARVMAHFRTGRIWPNGRVDYTDKQVVPFALRREDGRWLLASNGFLELVAREAEGVLERAQQVPRVAPRQLARYPAGSPARAFLEWFAALQRRDARTAAHYYAPSLHLSVAALARVREQADPFDMLGPPRIVRVATHGDVATVIIRHRTIRDRSRPELGFSVSAPSPFVLRKVDGRWVLPSNGFLEVLAAQVPAGGS
jgi:hypothetical protein